MSILSAGFSEILTRASCTDVEVVAIATGRGTSPEVPFVEELSRQSARRRSASEV